MTAFAGLIVFSTMSLFIWLCAYHPLLAVAWFAAAVVLGVWLGRVLHHNGRELDAS